MKCGEAKELFSDYLEGCMDYSLMAAMRNHIEGCPDCSQSFEAFKRTWAVLGTLPEVEPPYNLRHDIVMRIARAEHEKAMRAKQGTFGLTWSYMLARLVPARAIAIACAGVALAFLLLKVPSTIENIRAGGNSQEIIAEQYTGTQTQPTSLAEASLLSAHENAMREQWKNRKLYSNTLWITAPPIDVSKEQILYQIMLSINTDALVREATARIAAEVYLIPDRSDRRDYIDVENLEDAKLIWKGDVVYGKDCVLPWPVYRSAQRTGADKLLVTWTFRKRHFAQIIFIPTKKPSKSAPGVLGLSTDVDFDRTSGNLYSILDRISQDYGVMIIANAQLKQTPPALDSGTQTLEDALRKTLLPVGLTWRWFDNAIHVDKDLENISTS